MSALRAKSEQLTGYLHFLLRDWLESDKQVRLLTPAEPHRRGAQLSIYFASNGRRVYEQLSSEGVFCDWREDNLFGAGGGVIRMAPAPLYNSFEDVLNLALLTEQLDVMINVLNPVKETVMELVSAATNERREFETRFLAHQPPNRTLDGVRMIQSAANSLSPDLYSTVQASARIRNTADAVVGVLGARYSNH